MRMQPTTRVIIIGAVLISLLIVTSITVYLATSRLSKDVERESRITSPRESSPGAQKNPLQLDLPSSFPKDFPLPSKAKVTVAKEDEHGWTAVFLTTVTPEQILAFYTEELPKTGWTIKEQSRGGGLAIISTVKDNREAIIAIGKGGQGITISVTMLKSP